MTTADQDQPKQAPARPKPFQSLAALDAARKHARRAKARQDQSGEAGPVFHDPGALERRRADIDHAALAAFQVIELLMEHGAKTGHFCFMRRERDDDGNRTGERGPTFPVGAGARKSKAGKAESGSADPDPFTPVTLASVTIAKLRSWINSGRTKVTTKTKRWAREAELHFRLADEVRDIILVDDVAAARLPELRWLGLWRVVMETSEDNFQVLLKLPSAGGPLARQAAQAAVAAVLGGDARSTTSEKWHRVPGSYNNKDKNKDKLNTAARPVGIDWLTRLPITDLSNGEPVADGAPVPAHWLPAGWPAVVEMEDRPLTVKAPEQAPPTVNVDDGQVRALSSIKLPARVRKIEHDSTREFVTAAEYLKAGASLQAVFDHVLKLAEARGKYVNVKAGASAYVRRTLAGVMADFEHHLGAAGHKLFDRHESGARDIGCHPSGFKKAREAAADRAGRRVKE